MRTGIGIGIPQPIYEAGGDLRAAVIAALFGNGEQGALYDYSDLSTLFQDSLGTTPVTTDGDPVGLVLDLSQGLELGAELVTNGTFDTDISGWTGTGGGTKTWNNGVYRGEGGGTSGGSYQDIPTSSSFHRIQFDVRKAGGTGSVSWWIVTDTGTFSPNIQATVTNTEFETVTHILPPDGNGYRIYFQTLTGDGVIEADNVSVRELPGNHVTQAATAAKPLYRTNGSISWLERDGFDDELKVTTAVAWGAPSTLAVGHRRKTNTAKLDCVLNTTGEGVGTAYMQFLERISGAGNYAFRTRSDTLSAPNVEVATAAGSHPVDTWAVFVAKCLQGTTSIQKNNDTPVTAANAFGASTVGDGLIDLGDSSDGDLSAYVFVREDISEPARSLLVEWIAAKSGVTL